MERQKVASKISKEKNKDGGLTLTDFDYYEATIIKSVQYWWKNSQIDQRNRLESPEIGTCNIVSWSLTKKQRQYNGTEIVFATNVSGKTGHPPKKKKKKI